MAILYVVLFVISGLGVHAGGGFIILSGWSMMESTARRAESGAMQWGSWYRAARRRFHQAPPTKNDENADGMKTESRYFQPHQIQDRQRAGREPTPVGRRKCAVLEVGSEKVKVSDKENRQPF